MEGVTSELTPPEADRYFDLHGVIGAAGFATGDRVVIGHWNDSPIGSFDDIMWAEPDGWRTLFVADERSKAFITAIYEFDSVIVAPSLAVRFTPESAHPLLEAAWPHAQLEFSVGKAAPFPPRPSWVTRRIEGPIAKKTMKVDTYGVSPTGVYEWYRTNKLRRILDGWGIVAGRDLGAVGPHREATGFGFSEPPPFASVTEISPRLHDPSHRLDRLVDELNRASVQ